MKVVILTIGNKEAGSSLYRVFQFKEQMKKNNIDLTYIEKKDISKSCLNIIKSADLVINQKMFILLQFSKKNHKKE